MIRTHRRSVRRGSRPVADRLLRRSANDESPGAGPHWTLTAGEHLTLRSSPCSERPTVGTVLALMRPRVLFLLVAVAVAVLAVATAGAVAAAPAWTTYRHDAARSGIDPDSASPVTPSQAWQTTPLDGELYAQPLVFGANVYVATENDTVYALNASTGSVVWSEHLATPEPSTDAPCGDISPSIGITSTPVIDPTTNRIYAVGAVSASGAIQHELFALDLGTGQPISGFPINVDPPFPAGGSPVNQLQRTGLALDGGRILIGYGGNDGDCKTYWGWLVSAPTDGTTNVTAFQADASHHEGAIWAAGNAPPVDAAGNTYVATGNGSGDTSTDPDFGDAVVKLNASASPLDWWAPPNWQSLDSSDADLGSSMPTLLPGGYLFQSGKDRNGYVVNGAALGHVSAPVAEVSGFCSGGSFGGSVFEPAGSTIYAACNGGMRALSLGTGSPPTVSPKAGFSAPSGATGPPMIAGGLVWATNHSTGTLYGLDLNSGAIASHFAIPESGTEVNHFASPSAGGGRLFVASGNQVTAYTIAQPPAPTVTTTTLRVSATPVAPGATVSLTATVAPAPDGGTVTFSDAGVAIDGCSGLAVGPGAGGQVTCAASFAQPGVHPLTASYSGDSFDAASTSVTFNETVTTSAGAILGWLRVAPRRVSIAGRRVADRCVEATARNRRRPYCRRPFTLSISYGLSSAGTVTLTFKRVLGGRRTGRRCAKPTRKNRNHPRCTRLRSVPGSIALSGQAGANTFSFTGMVAGHPLPRGAYRVIAAAAAGSPQTATLKIVG